MKILVTGGAGFIGSHVIDKLILLKYNVVAVDNLSTGYKDNLNCKSTFYECDITSKKINEIFKKEKPNCVIHHAAQVDVQSSIKNPKYDAKSNIEGTINILEACVKSHVEKIIYASSAAIYGNPIKLGIDENHPVKPLSFYGISKYTCEQYIQIFHKIYGLKYTILRYANVYGPRQPVKNEGGVVSIFINHILENKSPSIYGDGTQTRDFVYVEDVAQANIISLSLGNNKIINIGTKTPTSINTLYKNICQLSNKSISPNYLPPKNGDIKHSYFDITKAQKELCWYPQHSLKEGLIKTIDYYKMLNTF